MAGGTGLLRMGVAVFVATAIMVGLAATSRAELATNKLATNKIATNKLATNKLATNKLAVNGDAAMAEPGDGAARDIVAVRLPDGTLLTR